MNLNTSFLTHVPQRGSLRQRLFAWINSQQGETFQRFIAGRKQALLSHLNGDILEIGPGSGPNLPYYPEDVRWVGIEPNPFLVTHLQKTLQELGRSPERYHIDPGDPQGARLPAPDGSLDAVVSTLVLCSVPHPEDSLREILRVLKPGGRFVFIEHVAAPSGTRLRRFQNFIQPIWTLIGGGCHPNRETWESIARSGFSQVEIEHFEYSGGGPVSPLIAGTAVKGH